MTIVADPDSGSGAFSSPGSGMDKIPDPDLGTLWCGSGSGIRIFFTLDPASGIEKILILDKHPGSATLVVTISGSCRVANIKHVIRKRRSTTRASRRTTSCTTTRPWISSWTAARRELKRRSPGPTSISPLSRWINTAFLQFLPRKSFSSQNGP